MNELIVLESEIAKRRAAEAQSLEPKNLYEHIVRAALAVIDADPLDFRDKDIKDLTPAQRKVCDTYMTDTGETQFVFPSQRVKQKSIQLVLQAMGTAAQAGFMDELLRRTNAPTKKVPDIQIEFTSADKDEALAIEEKHG